MARIDRPGYIRETECVFPNCERPVTERLDLPLCDRHAVDVYRAVHELMGHEAAGRSR